MEFFKTDENGNYIISGVDVVYRKTPFGLYNEHTMLSDPKPNELLPFEKRYQNLLNGKIEYFNIYEVVFSSVNLAECKEKMSLEKYIKLKKEMAYYKFRYDPDVYAQITLSCFKNLREEHLSMICEETGVLFDKNGKVIF